MLFYDWTWFILIPALAFALWAQSRVTSTFQRFSQVMASVAPPVKKRLEPFEQGGVVRCAGRTDCGAAF